MTGACQGGWGRGGRPVNVGPGHAGAQGDRLTLALTDPDVGAQLTRSDVIQDIAELLRRWDEPGRPALLLVGDWDPPFAALYPEDELRQTFPEVPLAHVGSNDEDGAPRLLVYVIDERGERAYAIPNPRARD